MSFREDNSRSPTGMTNPCEPLLEKPANFDPAVEELVNAALEISRKRRDTLAGLRTALEREDAAEALRLAKQLCGLTHEKESHRTDSGLD